VTRNRSYLNIYTRGRTIQLANSPPCDCRGCTGQKPYYGLSNLTYQRFTAMYLLIFGSLFLSAVFYCLRVFWCATARLSELELEQRTNNTHLVNLERVETKSERY